MGFKIDPMWEVNKDGTVKVFCIFQGLDNSQFSRYLPVRGVEYHWIPQKDSPDLLYIDNGYLILDDKEEAFLAQGIPPLVYREDDPYEVRQL